MKRRLIASLVVLTLITLGTTGCAHFTRQTSAQRSYQRPPPPRAFALAVTVNGVLQPTPAQWAAIQAKLATDLAAHGYILVTDLALADRILRVDFRPNPNDPDNAGHLAILGVRSNPRHALASTSSVGRYPTSFGYHGTFNNAFYGQGYSPNYYGWRDSFYDGYSYGSATLNPISPPVATKPANPPHRTPPTDRDCPPGENYVRALPVRLPGDFTAHTPADHPRSAPSERTRWRGGDDASSSPDRSYARTGGNPNGSYDHGTPRADAGSARSYPRAETGIARAAQTFARGDRTYTRSEPSSTYTRSEPSSYSSSSSSSSYSSSSYSSSSSSSYSSASSGSSYSGSSGSSGSSGTHESTNAQQN